MIAGCKLMGSCLDISIANVSQSIPFTYNDITARIWSTCVSECVIDRVLGHTGVGENRLGSIVSSVAVRI